jgi:phage baseplate assembly protein V
MFRTGIVKQQDLVNARVRVVFPDHDQMLSYWLPVGQKGTLHDQDWWMPDVGETVACDMDANDEDGVVERSIYTEANPPPAGLTGDIRQLILKDGAVFKYDRNLHALTMTLPAGATITIQVSGGGSITYDSSGNWKVEPGAGKVLIADAAGGTQPIARIGDQVTVPNVQSGSDTVTGTIATGSSKASAGG